MQELCLGCMNPAAETEVCPHCGYVKGTPAKEPYHIEPGTMLRQYLIGKVLGYGGFGVTYLGFDTKLNHKVAIKEYLPGELATRMPGDMHVTIYSGEKTLMFETGRDRFTDEARRLAKFTSEPGVVSILDEFDDNGTSYIVMEFLEGENLKTRLSREGKLAPEEAIRIITPILDALTAVHSKGIIHRDISPDNIFLTNDGRIKLLDFGAARYASSNQSKSLSVILKPGYAPEEQYRSRGEQGPWSDVYACAATFYKMITGITPEDAMERTIKDELKPPSKLGIKIDKRLQTALMNALNIYKDNRTQTPAEFKEQISGNAEVVRLRNTHKLMDIGSWKPWHKALLVTVVGVLAVAIGLAGYWAMTGEMPAALQVLQDDSMTNVPDVINRNEEQALSLVSGAGLTPMIMNGDYSETIDFGMIVNQNIPSGRSVQRNSYLELVMSLGRRKLDLEDMTGKSGDEVYQKLTQMGFNVTLQEQYSGYSVGTVCRQEPKPGAYEYGSDVIIVVSLGIDPNSIDKNVTFKLEDYVGRRFDEVQKELEAARITIRKETVYGKQPEGTIISQSVAPGTEVHQGEEIRMTVSLGEQTVRLGNYYAQNLETVLADLRRSGIEATFEYVKNDVFARDLIVSQSPDPDTVVLPSTAKVVLYVSEGREQANVPSVLNLSRADGVKRLRDAGFLVNETESFSDTVASGKIMEQDPSGGTAYLGQTIQVVVSKGRASVTPTSVSLNQSSLTLYTPSQSSGVQLSATVLPEKADDKRVLWSSDNPNVAAVSADGLVTASGTGSATITAKTNTGNVSASCKVTVRRREIESVSIARAAEITEYYQDDTLSTSGLELLVKYNSGEQETVRSGFSGSPTKLSTVTDKQPITVSYQDHTVSYHVRVRASELQSIEVSKMPNKKEYYIGDQLNTSGMQLRAVYSGRTETLESGFLCYPSTLDQIGEQTITVSYNGKLTSFTVKVGQPAVSTLSVTSWLHGTDTYFVGDSPNLGGLKLQATGSNGYKWDVSGSGITVSPETFTQAGEQDVEFSYGGKKVTQKVNVAKVELDSIEIRTLPLKTNYQVGDTLETGGLSLTAKYNNGTGTAIDSGFECAPSLLRTAGEQKITVKYQGKTQTFTVNVTEKSYLTGLSVVSQPERRVYEVGDTVDLSGLVLEATYSNGTKKSIDSDYTVRDNVLNEAGVRTVSVQYTEDTVTKVELITVYVIDPVSNTYDGAAFCADRISGHAGETVAFRVHLFNNPGYAAGGFSLYYDTALVPETDDSGKPKVGRGSALDDVTPAFVLNAEQGMLGCGAMGTENETDDGEVFTCYFTIPADAAPGTMYKLRPEVDRFTTIDMVSNPISVDAGYILVVP